MIFGGRWWRPLAAGCFHERIRMCIGQHAHMWKAGSPRFRLRVMPDVLHLFLFENLSGILCRRGRKFRKRHV